jgi:hypothetical protein
MNKLGPYITKLMTTVLDFKKENFVRDLALGELNRLKVNIEEFVTTNKLPDEKEEKSEKQLLQEDKKNVKDK